MNWIRWLDTNVERVLMLVMYVFMALIVGGEAIRRYLLGVQTQWGGTAAIHAFIFLSWLGCAYHVRRRTHIRFDGLRAKMSARAQRLALALDDVLWLVLAAIVIQHSATLVSMHMNLGATMEGTDDFPYWIAVAVVPATWALIAFRALQDLVWLAREGPTDAPEAAAETRRHGV